MTILAKDFLSIVKMGDFAVVRLATGDDASGQRPDWSLPQTVQLYVNKRVLPFKHRGVLHPIGEITNITMLNDNWAEYTGADWCPDFATFEKEEWRMEIQSLNGEDVIPA
jgi:hypothetical protein